MLRVTDTPEGAFHTPAMAIDAPGEVIIIRAGGSYDGKQGMNLATASLARPRSRQARTT